MMQGSVFRTDEASCITVTLLVLMALPSHASGTLSLYIDHSPVSTTAFLGTFAKFHCSSIGGSVFWFMNETLIHLLPKEYNASSVSRRRSDGDIGGNSTLTVLASEVTNETQYVCGVLDTRTSLVVNYSTPVVLNVQGKPLPPTGLQLHIGRGDVENQRIIILLLSWEPTRTLFDKTYNDGLQSGDSPMEKPRPHYVVYVYLESHVDHPFLLLYRNETTSLSNVVYVRDLNLTSACNLPVISFHVSLSAKFDEVGEGNKSVPVQIGHSDADSICRESMMLKNGGLVKKRSDDDTVKIVVGTSVGAITVFLITATTVIVIMYLLWYRHHESVVKTQINDAYGHGVQHHHYEDIECPRVKTHPNTAYEPVETTGKMS